MKKVTKKIFKYMSGFKDVEGNQPDMMIVACLFQIYTDAYIKLHQLKKCPEE